MRIFKHVVLILVTTVLLLPVLQKLIIFYVPFGLNGAFYTTPPPDFSWKSWKNRNYQAQYEINLNDSIGFKPIFVRLYNQLDYSLFTIPHAAKVVVGKNEYLFEDQYIKSFLGREFIGIPVIDYRVKQLKVLQDKLWNRYHILLLVIFPPDKGTFYGEYIPDRFLNKPRQMSNYCWNKKRMEESRVNLIDFNEWFMKMKDTSRYILYPKTGIHWSSYGAGLAFDSLVRYLQVKLACRLPKIVVDSTWISTATSDRDADIWEGMNLMWRIPAPPMTYMTWHYDKPEGTVRPMALFIGDSFYTIWANAGYIDSTFSNNDFWYYNYFWYKGVVNEGRKIDQVNILKAIEHQNVIVIMQTNGGYGLVGYDFVDKALNALDSADHADSQARFQ